MTIASGVPRGVRREHASPIVVVTGCGLAAVTAMHHVWVQGDGVAHEAIDHAVLMVAVMVPLAAPTARLVVERSLSHRWRAALIGHVAGYSTGWMLFALPAALAATVSRLWVDSWLAFAILAATAAIWQLSNWRRRLSERVDQVRVGPPAGLGAFASEIRGGSDQARRCVATCCVSMLAMAAAPSELLMGVVLATGVSEFLPGPNPNSRCRQCGPALSYAALALLSVTVWVISDA